jgi:hypothetical protein
VLLVDAFVLLAIVPEKKLYNTVCTEAGERRHEYTV